MSPPRFCEGCGREAPPDAGFCGGCGRRLRTPPGEASLRADSEADSGAPSGSVTVVPGVEEDVFKLHPVYVQGVGEFLLCVVTVGIAWVFLAIARCRDRYRITTQRIELQSGLATVLRRTIDLFRVHDLEVREPFFLRMRGAGHLVVRSQDTSEPEVILTAIPDVQRVHETLRALVNAERRRQPVKVIAES